MSAGFIHCGPSEFQPSVMTPLPPTHCQRRTLSEAQAPRRPAGHEENTGGLEPETFCTQVHFPYHKVCVCVFHSHE